MIFSKNELVRLTVQLKKLKDLFEERLRSTKKTACDDVDSMFESLRGQNTRSTPFVGRVQQL